jgi:hypothetical protein
LSDQVLAVLATRLARRIFSLAFVNFAILSLPDTAAEMEADLLDEVVTDVDFGSSAVTDEVLPSTLSFAAVKTLSK